MTSWKEAIVTDDDNNNDDDPHFWPVVADIDNTDLCLFPHLDRSRNALKWPHQSECVLNAQGPLLTAGH